MRYLILSCLLFFACASCATMAQRQAASIRQNWQLANKRATACLSQINANPDYQSLTEHTPPIGSEPSLKQMIDERKPSDEDIKKIFKRHDEILICRKQILKDVYGFLPGLVPILTEAYYKSDLITADLVQRKISWGEANKRYMALEEKTKEKVSNFGQKLDKELAESNEAELARRQAAYNAWMHWQQNQQLINSLNRPVNTNCINFGNSTNCTSY